MIGFIYFKEGGRVDDDEDVNGDHDDGDDENDNDDGDYGYER